jgi:hypothetical protein
LGLKKSTNKKHFSLYQQQDEKNVKINHENDISESMSSDDCSNDNNNNSSNNAFFAFINNYNEKYPNFLDSKQDGFFIIFSLLLLL